jgi:hypothetical protein
MLFVYSETGEPVGLNSLRLLPTLFVVQTLPESSTAMEIGALIPSPV